MFYLQVSVVRNEMAVLLYGAELVQISVVCFIDDRTHSNPDVLSCPMTAMACDVGDPMRRI